MVQEIFQGYISYIRRCIYIYTSYMFLWRVKGEVSGPQASGSRVEDLVFSDFELIIQDCVFRIQGLRLWSFGFRGLRGLGTHVVLFSCHT